MEEMNTTNRILVCDDQDLLREMLSDFLSAKGYEIVEACNGKECIEHAEENKFQAIFLDVRMPEMDGLAALDRLKEMGVETPIFIMSGYGEIKSYDEARERGAQDFLSKPFKLDKALELLKGKAPTQ